MIPRALLQLRTSSFEPYYLLPQPSASISTQNLSHCEPEVYWVSIRFGLVKDEVVLRKIIFICLNFVLKMSFELVTFLLKDLDFCSYTQIWLLRFFSSTKLLRFSSHTVLFSQGKYFSIPQHLYLACFTRLKAWAIFGPKVQANFSHICWACFFQPEPSTDQFGFAWFSPTHYLWTQYDE